MNIKAWAEITSKMNLTGGNVIYYCIEIITHNTAIATEENSGFQKFICLIIVKHDS